MPFHRSVHATGFRRQAFQGTRRSAVWLLSAFLFAVPTALAEEGESDVSARGEAYYHYALGHLYHQFAQQYMRPEYVDRAVAEYNAALEADPGSLVIQIEMINLYAGASQLHKAVELAEEILADKPDNVEVHKLLGSIYRSYATRDGQGLNTELLDKAISQFVRVTELEPDNAGHFKDLGLLYRAAQEPERAEKNLKRALELDGTMDEARAGLAYLLLERRKFQEAIAFLEAIVGEPGADRRFLNALADAYEQTGRPADAAKAYDRIISEGGNTLQARRRLAENLFQSRQFTRALQYFRGLAALDTEDSHYPLRIAMIHGEREEYEQAWESLEHARRLDPDSVEVQWTAIGMLEAEGRLGEAIQGTSELLESTRKDEYTPNERRRRAALLERLGVLQRETGSSGEAAATFHEIGELNPGLRPKIFVQVIETWRRAGDFARAESEAKRAVAEFQDDEMLASLLASVLADRGKTKEAIKVVERASKGSASGIDRLLTMARIYQKGRQFDKAEERIKAANELADSDEARIAVLFAFGSLYEQAKRFEMSEASFRELLEISPDNAGALNYLGYMFADRGVNLDEAHDLVQRALDLEPDNGAYLDSLGWVYYRQDKLELAAKYIERSLKQYEDDPVVHTHLGDVYYKQGRIADAKQHWSRGLQEWNRSAPADRDAEEVESLRRKLSALGLSMAEDSDGKKKDAIKRR